jgi:hypothetical protein
MSLISNKLLYINSKFKKVYETSSDFSVYVPKFLNLDMYGQERNDFYIEMSVVKAVIPYSFYNVSNLNNSFTLVESDLDGVTNLVSNTFFLAYGNYNIINLKNTILDLINAWVRPTPIIYEILYNGITNKITISTTILTKKIILKFDNDYTCHVLLGFNKDSTNEFQLSATENKLSSINVISLNGENQVYIKCNLNSNYNIESHTNNNNLTLISIPIHVNHFSLIIYEKVSNDNDIRINKNIIDDFKIYLTNIDNKILDLNGMDIELCICFKVYKTLNNNINNINNNINNNNNKGIIKQK